MQGLLTVYMNIVWITRIMSDLLGELKQFTYMMRTRAILVFTRLGTSLSVVDLYVCIHCTAAREVF